MKALTITRPVGARRRIGKLAGARPLSWSRPSTRTAQVVVAAAAVAMVGTTLWLGLRSDHLQKPVAAAVYWSFLIAASVAVGLYWWVRRPVSRFGRLLVAFGVLTWFTSWQTANAPLAFDLGVLAEGPFFVLTFYLFLAFPMGRVEPAAARWLMLVLVGGVVAFFLPWALLTPVLAGGGPLTRCSPACPANVLQVASAPDVVEVAGKLETYVGLAVTVAVLVVYGWRFSTASRPQRRALMAVAVTSLLFLPAYFVTNLFAWVLMAAPSTVEPMAWGIVATRVLLPLGFLIALLQAGRFATRALRILLERLLARPTPEQWRDMVAAALDDPALRLGYRDPATGRFREPDASALEPSAARTGRAWVPIERDGRPVAAMIIDETLTEDPELVGAAASATLLAVENGALEGELRASRARILEAGHSERRRIERDLHDGAQQRLIALRMRLAMASEHLDRPLDRALLERLGVEVEETIDELRDIAHGVYPLVLSQAGVGTALKDFARRCAIPLGVHDGMRARHPEALETAVYFCCLEAVQNAAKHAGPDASATIRLEDDGKAVRFRVEDDGAGFDLANVERGAGLTNVTDRVAALGGTLRVHTGPGVGTRIMGEIPT